MPVGKAKGQTHDFRVEYYWNTSSRPQRRVRDDEHVATRLARKLAREGESTVVRLIHVDPTTKCETELIRYDADHPPPANDNDLRQPRC